MAPLKGLVLEVFLASALGAFAIEHCGEQRYATAMIEGFFAAGNAASAVRSYKKVQSSLDDLNHRLKPS